MELLVATSTMLHKYLRQKVPELFPSFSITKTSFLKGLIKVNGKLAREKDLVEPGMKITIDTTPELVQKWMNSEKIDIIYETDQIAIIFKKPGAVVLGGTQNLAFACKYQLKNASNIQFIHPPSTSSMGLTIVSKDNDAFSMFHRMWSSGSIEETWRVICHAPSNNLVLEKHSNLILVESTKSKSSNSGSIWTVDMILKSGYDAGYLRKLFLQEKIPIIGNSRNTVPVKSAKNRGIFECLIQIDFEDPYTNENVSVKIPEPDKFTTLRERELAGFHRFINDETIRIEGDTKSKIFFGNQFLFNSFVLTPRNASETLVSAALEIDKGDSNVVDLGTGTCCLLLSFLIHSPSSTGVGIDISPESVQVANQNIQKFNLQERAQVILGDFESIQNLESRIDIVLCNPPYLSLDGKKKAPMTMLNEPELAVVAGETGLEIYHRLEDILVNSSGITPSTTIFIEIGHGTSQQVCKIFENRYYLVRLVHDQYGLERCCVFRIKE